jgi:tight adherence protein B
VKRRGGREVLVALTAIVVSFYALVAPASAAQDPVAAAAQSGPSVVLRRVDSTDPTKTAVVFQYDGDAKDVSSLELTENAKPITPTTAAAPTNDVGLAIVLDDSASTDKTAVLDQAKTAAKALVASLPATTKVAVVKAGGDAVLMQALSNDKASISKQIDLVTPSKASDGALWEGVARAAAQFRDTTLIPNILLITDGNDGSGTSFADGKGAVLEVGAEVFAVGVGDNVGSDASDLATLTGGRYQASAKAADIPGFVNGFAPAMTGQYSLTYASTGANGVNDVTLKVGSATAKGSFVAGSLAAGAQELAFQAPTGDLSFFEKDAAKLLAVVLGLLAAGLGAYALISLVVKDDTGLSAVLQPYSDYVANEEEEGAEQGMAQTALMQRAVELTQQFAERQGFLTKVEGSLERANLPLRAAEAMFFYAVAAAIVGLLALGLSRNIIIFVVVLGLAVLLPPAVLNFLATKRKKQFNALLPDTLQLLSGTLRAGYSMMQGVEAVSQEVAEPMGRELRRVVTESRLGRPLETSLDAVAERMDSPDFAWAVMAIRIQREVGGNLSELLMTVAQTMTQRERLRRDVSTLTAEGRVSAYVLGILPIGLGGAMLALNPKYMDPLFDTGLGNFLFGAGLLMMIIGFVWMNKLVKVEI